MIKDLYNNAKVETALDLVVMSSTSDFNGNAIDTQGYESGIVTVQCTAYTSGSVVIRMQDSADGSTGWADIASALVVGKVDGLGAVDEIAKVGYVANKQFVRVVAGGGTATVATVIGTSVLSDQSLGSVPTHVVA